MSVVIGVVGDDVLATPQGSGNERRKTTDGAGQGGNASDVSICPHNLHQLCLQLSKEAAMISSGLHRVLHADMMVTRLPLWQSSKEWTYCIPSDRRPSREV